MNARLFVMMIIMISAGYLIYAMGAAGEKNAAAETQRIKEVIDKALVQCYALEGSYPYSIDHLRNYGVIIDEEKYIYSFDMFVTNVKPSVTVILR